ncbi:glycine betaine ABC transporter substrate-binding protein [Paraherbaspirillum soli]|uniref:Glycine betaine ABC transporter substrate-binding protein n=1 Tax=Paraherbaspirillum soli TaxID=631222 RepID=A0ABW0MAI9_9BURK
MSKQIQKLVIATIDLSFHVAASAVVRSVLAPHGIALEEIRAPHEQAFELLRQGKADLLCSAWLPGSHGAYVAPMLDQLEQLAVLYEPYALWGVPDYVPAAEVRSVADLARPDVAQRMTKLIQGIGPGAGISRFSREIMTHYQLDRAGYRFENGSLIDCVTAFEQAAAEQRWCVVPLWQPQYLHWTHGIRELEEPSGLLRGKDQATLMVRKTSLEKMPESALASLRNLSLGNRTVTYLDYLISSQRQSPDAAVRLWQDALKQGDASSMVIA